MKQRLQRAVGWLSLDDRFTAIAMGVLVLYYCFTWGPWQGKASGDGWFGFLYLKSIVYFHTLDMRYAAPEFLRFFGESGPRHVMPNRCPFGPTLLWLPFYLLVAIPETILMKCRLIHPGTLLGQSVVHVWVTGLGTLGAVLLGWRSTLKLFARHVPMEAARVGAMATIFATPLLWYTAHQSFYQHGIAFMCIAFFFEYWERTFGQSNPRRFVVLGLVLGYAATVRAQEVVYILPLAIEIVVRFARGPKRLAWLAGALVSATCFLVAFTPQALVWLYYSGKVAPIQAEPIRLDESWPMVVLFSTRAGLFCWTPIAFIGLWGVVRNIARRDATGRLLRYFGFAFLVGFYIVSCAWVVAGAFAFGARRLSDAMGLVGLGIALVMAALSTERARRIFFRVVIACIVLNVGLMTLLRARLIPSPGSRPRALAEELGRMHAPMSVQRIAAYTGWPFCEPAALLWSLYHRLPIATYESVVGELVCERDGQWLTLINHRFDLSRANRWHVGSGLRWDDDKAGIVTGPVRIPMSQFATEPVRIDVLGTIAPGPIAAHYNGVEMSIARRDKVLHIARVEARAGYDELVLDVPIGSRLEGLDIQPLAPIKHPHFPRRAPVHRRTRSTAWRR